MTRSKDLLDAMAQFVEDLGISPQHIAEILHDATRPPDAELVRLFFEEDWRGFRDELEGLLQARLVAPRISVYERMSPDEDEEEEKLAEGGRTDTPWQLAGLEYAPPAFMRADPDRVRQWMDGLLVERAGSSEAVAVWIIPVGHSITGDSSLLLFFRDADGEEEMYLYGGGLPHRVQRAADRLAMMMKEWEQQEGGSEEGYGLVRVLNDAHALNSVNASAGLAKQDAVTSAQWAAILQWVASSDEVRKAMDAVIQEHVTPVLEEAQDWMRTGTRAVPDLIDLVRKDSRQALEQLERAQEKRLKGLRSDVGKLRMLADGARKRADKTDSDNQALRRRLREVEGAAAVAPQGSETLAAEVSVRKALDAFF